MHLPLVEAIVKVEERPAVYVLLSNAGDYLYKGACRNLKERLKDHHAGRAPRTRNRRPLTLVHYEYFDLYTAALRREKELKSGHGRAWLKDLLHLQQTGQTVPPEADPPPAGNLLA